MKETILKYFQEIKVNIEKNLDTAISKNASKKEINLLLDYLFEVNKLIGDILKSLMR